MVSHRSGSTTGNFLRGVVIPYALGYSPHLSHLPFSATGIDESLGTHTLASFLKRLVPGVLVAMVTRSDLKAELPQERHLQHVASNDLLPSIARGSMFYKPDFTAFKAAYAAATTTAEHQELVVSSVRRTGSIMEHAALCRLWSMTVDVDQRQDQRCRVLDFKDKLVDVGFGDDIPLLGLRYKKLFEHPLVHSKADPLTDHEWKMIRPKIVQFMEGRRTLRLNWEKRMTYTVRLGNLDGALSVYSMNLSSSVPMPQAVDLSVFPEIRTITVLPLEITNIRPGTFAPELPTLVSRWRSDVEAQLEALASFHSKDTHNR
ncbi:hypothetical protein SCP_1900800 [Sparassis crispa]|uniref:Uncharacterized protein n=1 Tax=Sparassis crispa TaxID=139825 RepID=A0A401H766_9APHY|nr:hypothetical protein SCP_1900800 [Sparassis crispa]GBE90231.1 hypothetical protein SCP_1900800 [Sparassis crispa]